MKLIICPGFHISDLTSKFLTSLFSGADQLPELDLESNYYCFPTEKYPSYSGWHLYHWLGEQPNLLNEELVFIAFSAGVVASIGAAMALSWQGVRIKALVALDGWGVPLWASFPIYRFSHDYFTHWSSALLGSGQESFYAYPGVDHLQLWSAPESCPGWICRNQITQDNCSAKVQVASTARDYLLEIITSK